MARSLQTFGSGAACGRSVGRGWLMDGTTGSVGLVVVGLGGVGSSLLAGIEAARANLVHPWGSLVEGGGVARGAAASLRDQAPIALLSDLVLGGFELKEDDAFRAALRAGLLSRSLVDELRPQLRRIRTMLGARQAPTRRHLADAFAEDLRGFLAHNHCSRGVVVCTVPGLRALNGKVAFTSAELWDELERGADWVSPGLIYAAAAAQAGFGFVGAARDAALSAPGLAALFAETGQPLSGAGLVGADVALRDALAQVLAAEGLGLAGAASLSTRVEERGARLWGGPDRTQEMALASAWAGGAMELSVELRGQTSLYLAGRALDAALLTDLAGLAGRKGPQDWMDGLFASPLGAAAPREAAPKTLQERRARMIAELPALAVAATQRSASATA